jgi:hypothetical protein
MVAGLAQDPHGLYVAFIASHAVMLTSEILDSDGLIGM